MKSNRSLALSNKIQELRTGDIIGLLEKEFPESIFDSHENSHEESPEKTKKSRARVFTENNTLLSMVQTNQVLMFSATKLNNMPQLSPFQVDVRLLL